MSARSSYDPIPTAWAAAASFDQIAVVATEAAGKLNQQLPTKNLRVAIRRALREIRTQVDLLAAFEREVEEIDA